MLWTPVISGVAAFLPKVDLFSVLVSLVITTRGKAAEPYTKLVQGKKRAPTAKEIAASQAGTGKEKLERAEAKERMTSGKAAKPYGETPQGRKRAPTAMDIAALQTGTGKEKRTHLTSSYDVTKLPWGTIRD